MKILLLRREALIVHALEEAVDRTTPGPERTAAIRRFNAFVEHVIGPEAFAVLSMNAHAGGIMEAEVVDELPPGDDPLRRIVDDVPEKEKRDA